MKGKISTTAKKERTLYHLNEAWQQRTTLLQQHLESSCEPTTYQQEFHQQSKLFWDTAARNRQAQKPQVSQGPFCPSLSSQSRLCGTLCNTSSPETSDTHSPDCTNGQYTETLYSRRQDATRHQMEFTTTHLVQCEPQKLELRPLSLP